MFVSVVECRVERIKVWALVRVRMLLNIVLILNAKTEWTNGKQSGEQRLPFPLSVQYFISQFLLIHTGHVINSIRVPVIIVTCKLNWRVELREWKRMNKQTNKQCVSVLECRVESIKVWVLVCVCVFVCVWVCVSMNAIKQLLSLPANSIDSFLLSFLRSSESIPNTLCTSPI